MKICVIYDTKRKSGATVHIVKWIQEALTDAKADPDVEIFYRHYEIIPVAEKYLCVVVNSWRWFYYNCVSCRYDKYKLRWKRKGFISRSFLSEKRILQGNRKRCGNGKS